jgi:hypothetical protein
MLERGVFYLRDRSLYAWLYEVYYSLIVCATSEQQFEVVIYFFSNTNVLYCFYGAFELTRYVSYKICFFAYPNESGTFLHEKS